MWTHFWDMSSGGSSKEDWNHCFIQLSEKMAISYFYNKFGHSPSRVTCTCCGEDYAVTEYASLARATGYQRGCASLGHKTKQYAQLIKDAWYQEHYYLEPEDHAEAIERGYIVIPGLRRDYKTLKQYAKDKDVLIVYLKDIDMNMCVGSVPEQGYVWRD